MQTVDVFGNKESSGVKQEKQTTKDRNCKQPSVGPREIPFPRNEEQRIELCHPNAEEVPEESLRDDDIPYYYGVQGAGPWHTFRFSKRRMNLSSRKLLNQLVSFGLFSVVHDTSG